MATIPLNINQLVVLATVVEHGNYPRAAEALGVSQPSVSQEMRDLERACGLPLLEQHGRQQVTATSLGSELATLGRRIRLDGRRGAKLVSDYHAGLAGKLTIGASMTTGAYYVPRVLVQLRSQHPGIAVDVEIASTAEVAQATVDELVDFGVVEGNVDRLELIYQHVGTDALSCIASSHHELAGRDVDLATLLDQTLLLREPGSGTREALTRALALHDARFEATIDVGSNDAILQAVAEGLGIAWLSERAVAANAGRPIGEIGVRDVSVARELGVVRRSDRALAPAAQDFVDALAVECAMRSRVRS